VLDRLVEPFSRCFPRWYGKRREIDDEIRERFEPALLAVTREGERWDPRLQAWRRAPDGLLALVLLLDQLPRNMYRDTPAMYAHDPLALAVATLAIREYEDAPLSLVRRMFLYVPLMHVENVTIQQSMVRRFEGLAAAAAVRTPHSLRFFEQALDFARRHRDVIARFGRFPHRNEILGRSSTPEETTFLESPGSRF
jgi:uncharacterized protein (DUF924 family)